MISQLANQHCTACKIDTPPLEGEELESLQEQLDADWAVVQDHLLEKEYTFDSYFDAVEFLNRVAQIAQEQDHHPEMVLSYGKVKITTWTHKIGGLSVNDFVLAAKAEEAFQDLRSGI